MMTEFLFLGELFL